MFNTSTCSFGLDTLFSHFILDLDGRKDNRTINWAGVETCQQRTGYPDT